MKVVFVHKSPIGASGRAAMIYYPVWLARMGHEIVYVGGQGGDVRQLVGNGVRVVEAPLGRGWNRAVRRVFAAERPDIGHVYLFAGAGLVPLLGRRLSPQTRFVLDIRSPLLRSGVMRLAHRAKNFFEPLTFDAVASHGIESGWTQLGRRDDLVLLPPGVDLAAIGEAAGQRREADGAATRLVYIGSLSRMRGLEAMLDAVAVAADRVPLRLDLYGDGNGRAALERRAAGLDWIRFMGQVDRAELFARLPGYDLGLAYVPGGVYEFAPALKTLEYLACGLPVLATDTLGNRMFVRDGENGALAGIEPAAYAEALAGLCTSGAFEGLRPATVGSVQDYDWPVLVRERLLPLYGQLAADRADG